MRYSIGYDPFKDHWVVLRTGRKWSWRKLARVITWVPLSYHYNRQRAEDRLKTIKEAAEGGYLIA